MKEQNTVEILSCSRCDELETVLKDIARDLDEYTPSSEAFRLATIAKNVITKQESKKEVCNCDAPNKIMDTLGWWCVECGKQIGGN